MQERQQALVRERGLLKGVRHGEVLGVHTSKGPEGLAKVPAAPIDDSARAGSQMVPSGRPYLARTRARRVGRTPAPIRQDIGPMEPIRRRRRSSGGAAPIVERVQRSQWQAGGLLPDRGALPGVNRREQQFGAVIQRDVSLGGGRCRPRTNLGCRRRMPLSGEAIHFQGHRSMWGARGVCASATAGDAGQGRPGAIGMSTPRS